MTRWTPDQRADAIGRALAVGADKASEMTGIPRRTISSWLSGERPAPELDVIRANSRSDVAARLWEAVVVGTDAVLEGLRDPKARLGDKAQALRIVAEQYALLTGGATSHNINLNADVANGWGSEQYAEADLETREQAQALLREAIDEMLTGTRALRLAGASTASIQLDGLTLRANLSESGVRAVETLLSRLEGAIAAGVDPSEIIAALTAKQMGDGIG